MALQVVAMLGWAAVADLLRPRWKAPAPRTALDHPAGCGCWRCGEARGDVDELARFRSRAVDPLGCGHDDDAAVPLSGDGWMCGDCGADIPAPKGCER